MKEKLIRLILASKIFDDRQKWGMIDYVKKNDIAENDVMPMMGIFERGEEGMFLDAETVRVMHEGVLERIKEKELQTAEQDKKEEDEILKQLNNL